MIELARHIEILLLENDCVIVPELGGFIAHYQPARYMKEENLYLPPVRTIGFNPQLTLNDGLLVQSYMQAHHTDFPDATRMIEEEVDRLKESLYESGQAELHGIGILRYNIQGNYEFQPNEGGALSPALYGLGSFSINRLEYLTAAATATICKLHPQNNRKRHTFHIKRQWLGNAVAAAAAVLLFFFLSVPVENTYVDKGNYASLGTDGLFDAIRSQSLATTLIAYPQQPQKKGIRNNQNTLKPVTVKVEKVAPSAQPAAKPQPTATKDLAVAAATATDVPAQTTASVASAPKPADAVRTHSASPQTAEATSKVKETAKKEMLRTTASQTDVPQASISEKVLASKQPSVPATASGKQTTGAASGKYCIIVSSLPTEKDAQDVMNSYKRQGYKGACIIEGGGRYRIALQRFDDKASAYQKLNDVRKNDAFKSAWILTEK